MTARGARVAQAAKDLDVHTTVLRSWVPGFGSSGTDAFPGNSQLTSGYDELHSLRREVAKLNAEGDILKKAAAYFAKGQL